MLESIELMQKRVVAANNDRQHNRMVEDKLHTFHKALLYSYQTAWVRKDDDPKAEWVRALINPDRVKFDYDEKIISIDWEYKFKPGTTFEWGQGTGSHWIVLNPEQTELAYLRASCRRCSYLVATDPENHERFGQWVAIRGPVETKINVIQKAGIAADVPNLTLELYMAATERNRRTFDRYSRFEYNGRYWKVQAPDFISTPGIFDIQVEEDYECHSDDMFERPEPPITPVPDDVNEIIGDTSIKPFVPSLYSAKIYDPLAQWYITLPAQRNKEIEDVLDWSIVDDQIKITWKSTLSGSFELHYGNSVTKTILVESLF